MKIKLIDNFKLLGQPKLIETSDDNRSLHKLINLMNYQLIDITLK